MTAQQSINPVDSDKRFS